ncbi:adenine phosphoribosyltransferase [Nannocystis punicea]|uniref:Adenine phosphoribosyltransferase n=1 Tax=Nannocystis punicea TaxID=2995304 RepID=A0ABY7HET8_9BACT|nr:adenine phosphoribosyltransferase [Nannocystis poenicansa]
MRESLDFRMSESERAAALRDVGSLIRGVPDFPSPGILFRDITPVLRDPGAMAAALRLHLDAVADLAGSIDRIVGVESRGFLFGMPIAHALGVGFVPARKPGKLPAATVTQSYALEYGEGTLHMHADAIDAGDRVLLVDDLLATGGTASAAARLVQRLGGEVVASLFLIELPFLKGRERLAPLRVEALLPF